MIPADVGSCHEAAEECRRLAAEVTDPIEKQELLHIAEEWLALPEAQTIVLALQQLAILG